MSASASKKKRKELEEQGLSAKDLAAQKEREKKNKALRNILIVALAILVCAAAVFAVISLINRPSYDTKATVATVGSEKISVPVYDYFYNNTVSQLYTNSYMSYFIEKDKLFSEQSLGDQTVEEYMKDATKSNIQEVLNTVAKAKEAGYKLSDEEKQSMTDAIESLKTEASSYGYTSTEKYLHARFGEGCSISAYKEYLELILTYTGYLSQRQDDFQPTAEELQAEYEKDTSAYDLVSYTYATSAAESTKVEKTGEEAEEGDEDASTTDDTVYTDEAKAAAKEKAESYLEEMPEDAATNTTNKSSVSSSMSEEIADWLFDDARKEGDIKVFAKTEEEIYFYTVRYEGRDTNDYCLVNANIISIAKDAADAEVKEGEQTAAEKKDALIAAIKDGMTDEEFSEAVSALGYTASTNSVSHTYSMEEIREWLFDESRKAGDIFTAYENDSDYYVIRYVSTDEETYRDKMIKNTLWNEEYESIISGNEIVIDEDLLKYAYTDLMFRDTSSSES